MPPKTGTRSKTTGKTSARSKSTKGAARSSSKTKAASTRARSGVPSAAGKRLVIVESPAKARTVGQILGNRYVVAASMGHVRDLPKSTLGVNTDEEFEPKYLTMKDKRDLVKGLKEAGAKASDIFLATDPDREGEAISWHLQAAAGWDKNANPPKRVVFHEITKQAVEEAFEHPREIDMELVNAQQARRILDRLVGYEISPLLWLKVQLGLSAGRVQSVALRMIVEREREIAAFVPEEWWSLEADLFKSADAPANPNTFTATLHSRKGARRKMSIPDGDTARGLESELKGASYTVESVEKKPRRQRPAPPFITSTLQQDAGRKLRFTAQRTMALAQQLYEGLNVGTEGSMGLITYMRTDSVNVAETAVRETREYIRQRYGKEYTPDKPRTYRTRSKNAQEAHEAIRPTSIGRTPQAMAAYLDRDQLRLYTLIWERMVASQMADALLEATTVQIDANCASPSDSVFRFRATGSVLKFPGFRAVYMEGRDDAGGGEEGALPELEAGDGLTNQELKANQHFTQPPPRFTEATLIKEMEDKGIGRPSTYAPTIATLVEREYVEREQRRLQPTELGCTVTDLLKEHFSDVMDMNFTARMEEDLDSVAQGELEWVPMLREFYGPFHQAVNEAEKEFSPVCDKCGQLMTMKMGRFGRFLACTGYPECQNIRNMRNNQERPPDEETDEICEKCERPMVIKTGRFGRFLACTGYNAEDNPCDNRRNIVKSSGVPCPKCGGDLVERRSRKSGRPFWGCANYPKCDFLVNTEPLPMPCPECEGMLVTRARGKAACSVCKWKGDPPAVEPEPTQNAPEPELATVGD
ncbi:MAG: type I DNA topoisomerase [Chloroflexi bacterium]|nr:type I DNA topoisomerase [Chloroflexota bacterium]